MLSTRATQRNDQRYNNNLYHYSFLQTCFINILLISARATFVTYEEEQQYQQF